MNKPPNWERGRDQLAKRYIQNPNPRTGRPMTADEAHKHAAEVARETKKRSQ